MQWRDAELAKLQEVRDLLSLNDEATTIRYLVARGMEAMNAQLLAARMAKRLEAQYSPQEVLPLFSAIEQANQKALNGTSPIG